jgi:hypothetical protein
MHARRVFETHDDVRQAAAAPRLSRTPGAIQRASSADSLLKGWGVG